MDNEISPPSFERALAQLERIVHDLEEGQIGLAEALARYEQGVALLRQCYSLLENAERRIQLLRRVDENGRAITEPFDDQATPSPTLPSSSAAAPSPTDRRSRPAAPRRPIPPSQNDIEPPDRLF